jgi:hypothetical protein
MNFVCEYFKIESSDENKSPSPDGNDILFLASLARKRYSGQQVPIAIGIAPLNFKNNGCKRV